MLEIIPVLIAIILAQISPGPNMMAVASVALGSGRNAGIATAAGVAFGVLIWALLFTFGIAAIFALYASTIVAIKLTGGCYLLYLSYKSVKALVFAKKNQLDPSGMKKKANASIFDRVVDCFYKSKSCIDVDCNISVSGFSRHYQFSIFVDRYFCQFYRAGNLFNLRNSVFFRYYHKFIQAHV